MAPTLHRTAPGSSHSAIFGSITRLARCARQLWARRVHFFKLTCVTQPVHAGLSKRLQF